MNDVFLADAMGTVSCLLLDSRIPPKVVQNDRIRSGQIQSGSPCFRRDEVAQKAVDANCDYAECLYFLIDVTMYFRFK